MNFIFARDRIVASITGRTVEFPKGVPTHCPPAMHAEVIAAGGVPEDELEDDTQKPAPEMSAEDRAALIRAAIDDMAKANERDDFTAAGTPQVKVVSARVGFTVSKQEVDVIWKSVVTD